MNTKLKIALIRRSSEQGFALPIAMGMGLIMLLIAATLMMRSHGDQTTALAQKATNRGLSAAETGITRYHSFINNNRVTATYKDCEGTRNSSGTCPDTGSTKSWTNATAVPGISSCSGGSGATAVANNSTVAWQDVNSSDSSLGQYRLVSYVYPAPSTTGTVGTAPGTGQLTVEGRVNQTGSGSTATQGASTATTRLQVNIPVLQPTFVNTPVPGAWITSGGTGGNQIDGNVLLNDCAVALSNINITATNSVTGLSNTKSYTSMSFPSLPSKPTPFITSPKNQVLGTINSSTMSGLGATVISGSHKRLTLPRSGDTANGSGVYEYSVTSIDIPNNSELVITPGAKVKLYLDGGITKGGNIIHSCGTTTGCKATDFQIFGYGAAGTQICMSGNNYIEAFIFAPEYTAGVGGGGGGAGGIKGSVWVKDWSNSTGCGSNTSNIVVVQNADWADIGLTPQNLPPNIASVSSWQRQETP